MNAEQHRVKARRIVQSLGKLDPAEDRYAFIDGTMIAGYHIGNALLHAHGVSAADVHWNTPAKLEISIEDLPKDVTTAFAFFAELEALRLRYVRNADVPDQAAAQEAVRLMRELAAFIER